MRKLTGAGFMINLRKCKFLEPVCELLEHIVSATTMCLNNKCIRKWLGIELPQMVSDLQSVLGRLNWASPFLPGYKTLFAPLESLLSRRGSCRWTQAVYCCA